MVLACLVAAASRAGAAPLDVVLFPAAPLRADGERAHLIRLYLLAADALVTGVPTVAAARGEIVGAPTPTSDGGVALRYRPPPVAATSSDTLTVTLRGQTAQLPVALEPAGRVRLSLEVPPGALVIGRDGETPLKVHVRDAAGRPARAALRVGASVGRVSPARELAPGEYQLIYTPPDERYPQVAIVAALSIADGAFAAAPIRLAAHITVQGEGEPGASMQIAIDGRELPAATVGADGRFSVPLTVPPGGRAVGVSTDRLGNQQRREIDLALPPFPRLLLGAVPATLPADGVARAEVVAFAVDARGNPERRSPPLLSADAGSLSPPTARGDGSTSWTFTAPAALPAGGDGAVTLRAAGGQTRITLRPGPPRAIEVRMPTEALPAGLEAAVPVEVRVRDEAGSPVAGAELTAALAGGRVVGVRERGQGRYVVELVPPRDPGRGSAILHVEVAAVRPGPPRRLTLHPLPVAAGQLGAEAWIDDDGGLPVPGARVALSAPTAQSRVEADRYGTARLRFARPETRTFRVTAQATALPSSAALDYLVVGGTTHAVASVAGEGLLEPAEPPSFPAVDVPLPLAPAAPLDLRIWVEPRRPRANQPVRVRVAVRGGSASQLLYETSAGTLELLRPPGDEAGELRFLPPADGTPGSRYLLSVTDAKTRVTAFTEVQLQ